MAPSSRQHEYYSRPSREELGDAWELLKKTSRLISWSTFQPQVDSSTLGDFWLVELEDAQGLLVKAIKTTRNHPAQLQSTWGLVVWTSLDPLLWWVPRPTTRWAPGTTRLVLHCTCWREAQGLQRNSIRIGSYTCPDESDPGKDWITASPMHILLSLAFAHLRFRPSRSDYDEQARSTNAIAEPQLKGAPRGKAQSPQNTSLIGEGWLSLLRWLPPPKLSKVG
jgi:hypothetical protein